MNSQQPTAEEEEQEPEAEIIEVLVPEELFGEFKQRTREKVIAISPTSSSSSSTPPTKDPRTDAKKKKKLTNAPRILLWLISVVSPEAAARGG